MWDSLLEKLARGEQFATPGDGLILCYEETLTSKGFTKI
jgi:hypothetical protein